MISIDPFFFMWYNCSLCSLRETLLFPLAYRVKRERGEGLKARVLLQKFLQFLMSTQMKSAK